MESIGFSMNSLRLVLIRQDFQSISRKYLESIRFLLKHNDVRLIHVMFVESTCIFRLNRNDCNGIYKVSIESIGLC